MPVSKKPFHVYLCVRFCLGIYCFVQLISVLIYSQSFSARIFLIMHSTFKVSINKNTQYLHKSTAFFLTQKVRISEVEKNIPNIFNFKLLTLIKRASLLKSFTFIILIEWTPFRNIEAEEYKINC